jgi:hypothetical protein
LKVYKLIFLVVAIVYANTFAKAQTDAPQRPPREATETSPVIQPQPTASALPVSDKGAVTNQPVEGRFSRWVELQTMQLATRYRFIENSNGVTTNDQIQHNEVFRGRFKIDPKGNYSVNASLASGSAFTSGWNNTGIGTGDLVTNLYLKQLYLGARPVSGVELQYGGLYILRGESTEITTYDNDAYIVGQRLTLKRPKNLYLDEISITYGFLGDLNKPSVFKRFNQLDRSNYHQFLISKSLGKRASLSADYTFESGVETLHEGLRVSISESGILDTFRFESYQRLDVNPDGGLAVGVEKVFAKKLTLGGGFATIDRAYNGLNADRFNRGNRLFLNGTYALTPEFSLQTFFTRAVSNEYTIPNRSRFDLILNYNLLKTLQRTGLF